VAVRVKVRLRKSGSGRWVETSALVNSGYEASRLEVVLPLALAKALGLDLSLASREDRSTPIGVGGLLSLEELVELQLLCEGRDTPIYKVHVLVSEHEYEVLISDYLAGELGIAIEDLREGLWRLRDEGVERVRRSVKPSYWLAT